MNTFIATESKNGESFKSDRSNMFKGSRKRFNSSEYRESEELKSNEVD